MPDRTHIFPECTVCRTARIDLGFHSFGGSTTQEQLTVIGGLLSRKGWALKGRVDGGIDIVCPDCAKRDMTPRLPPYDPKKACPKCGERKVSTKFCKGVCEFNIGDGHLHRTCARCGFEFVQATKDAPKDEHVSGSREGTEGGGDSRSPGTDDAGAGRRSGGGKPDDTNLDCPSRINAHARPLAVPAEALTAASGV